MDKQVVCCLRCEDLYLETAVMVEECPNCGNRDTEHTIYLEDSPLRREFLTVEEMNANE